MQIQSIGEQDYLWSVKEIFQTELINQLNQISWQDLPYTRLEIGRGKRRYINSNSIICHPTVESHIKNTLIPQIENQCKVKFTTDKDFSINWWVDEQGFRPAMHTDGDLPSALQIYLAPDNYDDLGTAFFHTNNSNDIWHVFSSVPNTGYLMFNSHKHSTERKLLWHDMLKSVPVGVYRVCCYVTLGHYKKIS